jgi:hypothetical protein
MKEYVVKIQNPYYATHLRSGEKYFHSWAEPHVVVVEAETAKDALEIMRTKSPSVNVVDIHQI